MTQKMHAEPGTICPLHRRDVSKVCHTCAWWSHIEGVHPQTGERVDAWQCAIVMQVLATMEAAKAATVGSATTQELRKDFHRDRQSQTRLLSSQPIVPLVEYARGVVEPDGQ